MAGNVIAADIAEQQEYQAQLEAARAADYEQAIAAESADEVPAASAAPDTAAETMVKKPGAAFVRQLWYWLIPTYGLTLILLDLVFWLTAFSSFFRRILPTPGEEWILAIAAGPLKAEELKKRAVVLMYVEIMVLGLLNAIVAFALAMVVVNLAALQAIYEHPILAAKGLIWEAISKFFGN